MTRITQDPPSSTYSPEQERPLAEGISGCCSPSVFDRTFIEPTSTGMAKRTCVRKPQPPSDLRHLHALVFEIVNGQIAPQLFKDITKSVTLSRKSSGERPLAIVQPL